MQAGWQGLCPLELVLLPVPTQDEAGARLADVAACSLPVDVADVADDLPVVGLLADAAHGPRALLADAVDDLPAVGLPVDAVACSRLADEDPGLHHAVGLLADADHDLLLCHLADPRSPPS